MIGQFSLLSTRRFLPVFLTQFTSSLNDNLFRATTIILLSFSADITSHKSMIVTLLSGMFTVPVVLFIPIAGQIADKYDKAQIIRICKIIETILTVFAIIAIYQENIIYIFITTFALGWQASIAGLTKYSILPSHLQEEELIAANGLINGGTAIGTLIGIMTSGFCSSYPEGKILIVYIMFITNIVGLAASFFVPSAVIYNPNLPIVFNIFSEINKLLKLVFVNRQIMFSIIGISWCWTLQSVLVSQLPLLSNNVLKLDEATTSLLLTIFFSAITAGSVICNYLIKGKVNLNIIFIMLIFITVFGLDLSLIKQHQSLGAISVQEFLRSIFGYRIMMDLLAIALAIGIYTVPLYVIIQTRGQSEYVARLMSANNLANAILIVIYMALVGLLHRIQFSVSQILFITAIFNLLICVFLYKLKSNSD